MARGKQASSASELREADARAGHLEDLQTNACRLLRTAQGPQ